MKNIVSGDEAVNYFAGTPLMRAKTEGMRENYRIAKKKKSSKNQP